jgi:hypothetical protein
VAGRLQPVHGHRAAPARRISHSLGAGRMESCIGTTSRSWSAARSPTRNC